MASRPSKAFRIADRRHPIFDGTGAFLSGARWNSPGRRIIYAAETFAGAMLEMLAHTRTGKAPRTQAWIEISIPPRASIERVEPGELPGWDWRGRSLILVAPSVVTCGIGRNVLINQDHPEFQSLKASAPRRVLWDS